MIIEKLKKLFDHIVVFDFEFKQDILHKGEKPDPICAVYKDIITQKTFRAYGISLKVIPFNPKKSLFVCYNAVAEASCLKVLGLTIPDNWWDCYVENRKLYMGRVGNAKGSWSMLTAANRYNIETMTEDRKKYEIEQILNNPDYPIEKILDYCEEDVKATEKLFIAQCKDIEDHFELKGPLEIIQHAQFHGRSMAAMAEIECNGMPIDNALFNDLDTNFDRIKKLLIDDFNKKYEVFVNYKFNMKLFIKFIDSLGLLAEWPKTPTGALSTTEKVIYDYSQSYPEINEFYFVKEFVEARKLKGFVVGPDGRARTSLNMFQIKTGRTNQSTALYPFNAAKPMRNILKPLDDHAYIYADYVSQEIAIAAYLSNDDKLIDAYKTGDVYIYTAKLAGAVPQDATKTSHKKERKLYKTATLATFYGQGHRSLAARLNIQEAKAIELIANIKNIYNKYFAWVDNLVNKAFAKGFISTKFGWKNWLTNVDKINPRSLSNFPIQAHGSEMLRFAILKLIEKKIEISASIHDGLLIHCPLSKLRETKELVVKCMEDASRIVLNKNKCDVDVDIIKSNFKQEEEEQIKFERIINLIRGVEPTDRLVSSNPTPV